MSRRNRTFRKMTRTKLSVSGGLDPHPRRGAVTVWAMLILMLVGAMAMTFSRLIVLTHRNSQRQRQLAQTECLAQTGWKLARIQLQRDPKYLGQVWDLSAVELGGEHPGRVTIEVGSAGEDGMLRKVHIVTEMLRGSKTPIRSTRDYSWKSTAAN